MRGNKTMDHTAVVREKTTERYLLNELDPEVRDEFEAHYFDCPECAQDVSAASVFVEHSKLVLAESSESSEPVSVRAAVRPVHRGLFAWLRPAFAASALALLLAVVGYQNLVTYPRLQSELKQPQILPAVLVNVGTYGAGETAVPEGKGLLLSLRISPDAAYARYTAELYNPAGKAEGSFTITPATGQDQWSVTVPSVQRQAGTYTLALHGVTSSGETKDLGNTSFELQIQR
jgi:Putative zinc-finger